MEVVRYDNHFCVKAQGFSLEFPDTPANRKVAVIFLRGMRDETGKPMFTLEELAGIVGSMNRQAASQPRWIFILRGGGFPFLWGGFPSCVDS